MSLSPGSRLGPFEVVAALGAGGMGEVYRAHDTHLNRDVAIKVLPDLFAADPERLTRFTREAQALAALNHVNVAQVYGVEGGALVRALVMEFVDGEDLAERLARGAVPVDEAVPIALQIARGLEAAHERGIVHRDLKPANVRITSDGAVKVLDFGLAKADRGDGLRNGDATSQGLSPAAVSSPTSTSPPTTLGMIIGTAAYMAPEQARGRPVDKRADIWAFGCVLYEMLTGKQPFSGDTMTDTLAAIVKEQPDWKALPAATPPSLRRLLTECLVKDPKQRLRDIGDARIVLERIIAHPAADAPSAVTTGRRFGAVQIAAAAAAVAAIASLATWLLVRPRPTPPLPVARFVTALPLEAMPLRSGGTGLAFAPDGLSVVYAAQPALNAAPVLFRRRLAALDVERMPNTDGAMAPFFSPDSRWIAFFTESGVMKVSVEGEGLTKICERTRFSRGVWASDDTIILGTSQIYANGPLARVPAAGGTAVDITALAGAETAHQLPNVLPDRRSVIFSAVKPGGSELAIAPIGGGAHHGLGVEGSGAIFVAPDHLLFARGRALFAVRFDAARNQISGAPQQVLDDAAVSSFAANVWIPLVAADRSGSVAYLNKGGTLSTLRWIAPQSVPVGVPEADYRTPSLSPDGRRVAVSAGAAPAEIWVADLERGTRLLLAPSSGTAPIWSHDGKRVIYAGASGDVMTVPADGSGAPEVLLARQGATNLAPTAAAPDGSFVVANAEDRSAARGSRNRDIWIVRPGQKPLAVVATPADDRGGVVSPDGRWLAYSSSISGREEIYIRPVAGGGATIPVSTQGGTLPRWPRMDTLYFLGSRTLMRVPIALDPLRPGTPVEAVELPRTMGGIDIDTNGRVLIIEAKATATGTRDALHVLLNWGRSLR